MENRTLPPSTSDNGKTSDVPDRKMQEEESTTIMLGEAKKTKESADAGGEAGVSEHREEAPTKTTVEKRHRSSDDESPRISPVKPKRVGLTDDANEIARHYNSRLDQGHHDRLESRIIRLRNFNNWIKAVLINEFVKPNDLVMDLACGKGGDFKKWTEGRVRHVTAIDIAGNSIEDAKTRYNKARHRYSIDFHVFDAFHVHSQHGLLTSCSY